MQSLYTKFEVNAVNEIDDKYSKNFNEMTVQCLPMVL